jgi:hypothetical protein
MSSLDLDLDAHMNNLELEWRQPYETSILARADYQALAASASAAPHNPPQARSVKAGTKPTRDRHVSCSF